MGGCVTATTDKDSSGIAPRELDKIKENNVESVKTEDPITKDEEVSQIVVARDTMLSNNSLTESHRAKLKMDFQVFRPSEIENSRVIEQLAEKSQISHNNSIWNSKLQLNSNMNSVKAEQKEPMKD
jgi:hypothetical protein